MVSKSHSVSIGNLTLANDRQIKIIAGPCVLESKEHAFEIAGTLVELAKKLEIGLIYKTSYDKANRTSVGAHRGLGLNKRPVAGWNDPLERRDVKITGRTAERWITNNEGIIRAQPEHLPRCHSA